jgi:hypothetical protein
MAKVSFPTKWLSNKHYIGEIKVEGKQTPKFFFHLGLYDLYMTQIIRSGNCITLLSTTIEINRDNFWNTHYFEDITRHIFWTFNKSFLLILTEKMETLDQVVIVRCLELLKQHFTAYHKDSLGENPDQEVQWCMTKNEYLLKDEKYRKMYAVDEQNRTALLEALQKRNIVLNSLANGKKDPAELVILKGIHPSFLETLHPINGNPEETLHFMMQKITAANFDFNIFSRVDRLSVGKNPYGLNDCIAAALDFFFQLGYFKKEYTLEQIFMAYSSYSGNTIGKLKVFISEFRHHKIYLKHMAKLKSLKINKL